MDGNVDEITFVTWTGGDAGVKWDNLAAAYEDATGTSVEIEIIPSDSYNQVVTSRIEAGNAPDVIEVMGGSISDFADGGLLQDLSDQPWVEDQIDAVDGVTAMTGGDVYVLTPALESHGVFYNEDIFAEHGVEVPATWDEFLSAVETFRAAGVTPLAVGGKDVWTLNAQSVQMAAATQDGTDEYAELVEGTLPYSESSWVDILAGWDELVDREAYDPQVLGIDWPSSANQFAGGDAAMLIQGSFALPAILAASPEMNVNIFPLPFPDGGEIKAVGTVGSLLGIPANTPHQEAALDFLTFLTEEENLAPFLTEAKAFSAITGVVPEVDPGLSGIAPYFEEGNVYSVTLGLPEAFAATYGSGLQGLISGSMTPDELLSEMDRIQQTQ